MDLHLAVRAPLDRWALVESLGLRPEDALDLESAHARVAHPTGARFDLVVLVRDERDIAFLHRIRQVRTGRSRPSVLAIVDDRLRIVDVVRAGADVVVPWHVGTAFPDSSVLVALEQPEDLVVVLPDPVVAPV